MNNETIDKKIQDERDHIKKLVSMREVLTEQTRLMSDKIGKCYDRIENLKKKRSVNNG